MSRPSLLRFAVIGSSLVALSTGSALAQSRGVDGHRQDHRDGSASVTVSRTLPTQIWETRVGADLALTAPRTFQRHLETPLQDPNEASHGVAWASAVVPGGLLGLWERTTLQARLDPHHDQGWVGTRFTRSVPVGRDLSLIFEDGYAYARPLKPVPQALDEPTSSWETDKAVRLKISPVHTTLSFGTRRSSLDGQWLNSVSAEQRIIGPLTVRGSLGETVEGTINRSISAGFSRRW